MDISDDLGQTFYGILGYDAVDAMNKMDANDSQSTRRDFAAPHLRQPRVGCGITGRRCNPQLAPSETSQL